MVNNLTEQLIEIIGTDTQPELARIKAQRILDLFAEIPDYHAFLIIKAHHNLTKKMGRPEYAPTAKEIEEEINSWKNIKN